MRQTPAIFLFYCAACGEPDLAPCEAIALSECDIRDKSCQEHYSDLLRCLRGDDQPTPKLEVLTDEVYRARYFSTPDSPAEVTLLDRGYALLSLGPGAEPAKPSVPAARYDIAKKTVIVVDTDDTRGQLRAIAQAHTDAALGGVGMLDEQGYDSTDQFIATLALYYGEVIFYSDAAWYKTDAQPAADFHELLRSNLYYGDEQADAARVARLRYKYDGYDAGIAFALGYGPDAVLSAWLVGGGDAVRAAYDPLIPSTVQVLRSSLVEELPTLAVPTVPALPDGVEVVAEDRLGPWLMHVFHTRAASPPEDTPIGEDLARADKVGDNWLGDRMFVVHDAATDAVGVILRVVIADAEGWSPAVPIGVSDVWYFSDDGREATVARAETVELYDALQSALGARG